MEEDVRMNVEQGLPDMDVLLLFEDRRGVEDPLKPGEFKVVTGVDEKKKELKTAKPVNQNNGRFKVYKKDDDILMSALVNLFKGFANGIEWGKNKVYLVPKTGDIEKTVSELEKAIQDPYKQEHKDLLAEYELNRWDYASKVKMNQVPWDYLEQLGVTKEKLEELDELENLLKFRKTNTVPIKLPIGGDEIATEARLTLYEDRATGDIKVGVRTIKKEPSLNEPFMGHEFTAEDRANLLNTGHLGRQVELVTKSGKSFMAYVSVDPQTMDLIPLRADYLQVPKFISGKELTDDQHEALVNSFPSEYDEKLKVSSLDSKTRVFVVQSINFDFGCRHFFCTYPALMSKKAWLFRRSIWYFCP